MRKRFHLVKRKLLWKTQLIQQNGPGSVQWIVNHRSCGYITGGSGSDSWIWPRSLIHGEILSASWVVRVSMKVYGSVSSSLTAHHVWRWSALQVEIDRSLLRGHDSSGPPRPHLEPTVVRGRSGSEIVGGSRTQEDDRPANAKRPILALPSR